MALSTSDNKDNALMLAIEKLGISLSESELSAASRAVNTMGGGSDLYTPTYRPIDGRTAGTWARDAEFNWPILDENGVPTDELVDPSFGRIMGLRGVIVASQFTSLLKPPYNPDAKNNQAVCQVVGYQGSRGPVKELPPVISSMYGWGGDKRKSDTLPSSTTRSLGLIGARMASDGSVLIRRCSQCIEEGHSTQMFGETLRQCTAQGTIFMVVFEVTKYTKRKLSYEPQETKLLTDLKDQYEKPLEPFILAIRVPKTSVEGVVKEGIVGFYPYFQSFAAKYPSKSDPRRLPRFAYSSISIKYASWSQAPIAHFETLNYYEESPDEIRQRIEYANELWKESCPVAAEPEPLVLTNPNRLLNAGKEQANTTYTIEAGESPKAQLSPVPTSEVDEPLSFYDVASSTVEDDSDTADNPFL